MLYLVHMRVELPHDMPGELADDIKLREKTYAKQLQEAGDWLHLWRVAGEYANYSVFDVEDHDRLHALLSALPLFAYMRIQVTPLAKHPSSIR